jgi:hypothetical protein
MEGPFEDGDFGETDCVFGSGGILRDESIRFVTSAATVDCLYYSESKSGVTVSNSLPLILGYTGDALNPRCQDYPEICDSVLDGIDEYRRDFPTVNGVIRRQLYRNLDVFKDRLCESDKIMPPPFKCFEDYNNYRRDNYALIVANAKDKLRTFPLEIWSTQSRGYDSTAINAMASSFGLEKVFTVTKAKSKFHLAHNDEGKSPDDNGSEICEALGVKCIPIDRRAFTEAFDDEHLYYCARHHNQDVNLKEISKHVVVIFPRPSIPYSSDLRGEFFKYMADAKAMRKYQMLMWPIVRWINSILMLKSEQRFPLVQYVERAISRVMRRHLHFRFIWSHLEGEPFFAFA